MILNCKTVADNILTGVKIQAENLTASGTTPTLALVRVLGDPASEVYVGRKDKACVANGVKSKTIELPETITTEQVIDVLLELNADEEVNAIMLQLPLPKHLDKNRLLGAIAPFKDADCLNFMTVGSMFVGEDVVHPCTPKGIMKVLKFNKVQLEGKSVLVINRSMLVGKPLVELLQREDATVTLAHSKTANLDKLIKEADIIITAVGKINFITKELINSLERSNKRTGRTQTIIDVSINVDESNKLNGDVQNNNKANREYIEKLSTISITPVPGGIGLTTVACLLENTIELTRFQLLAR